MYYQQHRHGQSADIGRNWRSVVLAQSRTKFRSSWSIATGIEQMYLHNSLWCLSFPRIAAEWRNSDTQITRFAKFTVNLMLFCPKNREHIPIVPFGVTRLASVFFDGQVVRWNVTSHVWGIFERSGQKIPCRIPCSWVRKWGKRGEFFHKTIVGKIMLKIAFDRYVQRLRGEK